MHPCDLDQARITPFLIQTCAILLKQPRLISSSSFLKSTIMNIATHKQTIVNGIRTLVNNSYTKKQLDFAEIAVHDLMWTRCADDELAKDFKKQIAERREKLK